MRTVRDFEEFLQTGVVRKRTPDKARADSLAAEAEKRKAFIEVMTASVGLSDKNANYFIENSYDVLIELLRAKLLLDGFGTSGEGAHEAEVSYLAKLGFAESDAAFMNDLRYFRNGILYYGKEFDAEYGRKVLEFLDKTYPKLKKLVKG